MNNTHLMSADFVMSFQLRARDESTVMRRLMLSEKRVVRRFRYCGNFIECTYTNLETWH
jgi:hypothetical protein